MKRPAIYLCAVAALLAAAATGAAQPRGAQTLDIYVVDTEGGKATLFVSPTGQTLLIDTGNPGERDLNRILEVFKEAGVEKLDYVLSTHYHVDHIGGMQALAARVPIAHFIDHGPTVEAKEQVAGFQAAYAELRARAKHTVVKPGDRVPITGIDWRIVTSAGEVLKTPLPGGGARNAACGGVERKPDPANPDENAHSVGSVITYGKFRAIDLGDLLWNKEIELICPNNPVGTVDLYLVTHHGLANSGAEALVHAVRPRVAVMQNGTRKGGAVASYEIMRGSPGLEDIWQLHWSHHGGIEHNPAGVFIANVDDADTIAGVLTSPAPAGPGRGRGGPGGPGAAGGQGRGGGRGAAAATAAHTPAHYIKISAQEDGTFTVTNSRNGFSKTYQKR